MNKSFISSLAIGALLIMSFQSFAQKSKKSNEPAFRFEYGLSLGGYFANPSTASYYDGSGTTYTENSVERTINQNYNYQRIRDVLGADFELYELPANMKYSPALNIGFFGAFNLTNKTGIIAECNYARLKTDDAFTLKLDLYSGTSEPVLEMGKITGTEERIDIRLGISHVFRKADKYIHPFVEAGGNLMDLKVVNNRVYVQTVEMSIISPRNQYYQVRDYGIGFGAYGSAGLAFDVNENFAFRIGGSVNYLKVNLGENTLMKPQYTLFMRIMLNPVVN